MTENQVYAAADGRPVTIKDGERESASRNGKSINATDYVFDVTVNGARHEVRVAVSRDAVRAVTSWLADPANFGSSESQYVDALLIDLCTAKILEAVDQGIDFEQDLKAYPDSFLKIFAGDLEQYLQPRKLPKEEVWNYIGRRLQAAWEIGTNRIDWAQLFDRKDAFYLRISVPDLEKVITLYNGDDWTMHADSPLLTPTPSLLKSL